MTIEKLPRRNEVWTHEKTGNEYVILDVLNTLDGGSEKFPVTVSYMSLATLERFCRTWEAFRVRFSCKGALTPDVAIDLIAVRTAQQLADISAEGCLGGKVQHIAKIQVAVTAAIEQALLYPGVAASSIAHQQLAKFYGAETYAELVELQAHHIEKLQARLPSTPSLSASRVREG